jgi:hypothetical protein
MAHPLSLYRYQLKLSVVGIEQGGRKSRANDPAGPGIGQSLMHNSIDSVEIICIFAIGANQFHLLISPCHIHRGMTLKRPSGQGWRDGKKALSENRPGPLSTPHINGIMINKLIIIITHVHNGGPIDNSQGPVNINICCRAKKMNHCCARQNKSPLSDTIETGGFWQIMKRSYVEGDTDLPCPPFCL